MALSKIFFVLALTAVAEAMACNPRKDATCCKDTDKCKNFSQLIEKNPEKCSSSKNFAKRCRASCDAKYPERNYCAQPDEENAQPDEENAQPDEENGQPDENGNSENDEAMPCNPRKDATCCKDTDKCKNFLQLIQKNPEKCGSSKNFAKRCRASCHAMYPTKNYCENGQPDEACEPQCFFTLSLDPSLIMLNDALGGEEAVRAWAGDSYGKAAQTWAGVTLTISGEGPLGALAPEVPTSPFLTGALGMVSSDFCLPCGEYEAVTTEPTVTTAEEREKTLPQPIIAELTKPYPPPAGLDVYYMKPYWYVFPVEKKAEAEEAIARQDITWPDRNGDDMVINCHAPYTGTFSVPFTPGQATTDGRRRLGGTCN